VHLVQLLLPVFDNQGQRIENTHFAALRRELTDRFGGVTLYTRSPATGIWKKPDGDAERDEVVMAEVVVETLDADWWHGYRRQLEKAFRQDSVLIRAMAIVRL
jgi:hypothetical protein